MEQRIGTRLKDRPEFYNKPKPVTFLKNDKVVIVAGTPPNKEAATNLIRVMKIGEF